MKAIVLFDRDKLNWQLVQLNLHSSFGLSLSAVKRCFTGLGRVQYPKILEVELDYFEVTGEKTYSWSSDELPKTPTIEECIAENRVNILSCLSKLRS